MKGNKIVIERYLEEGELIDSLDLSVNYLVKHTREGGTVPLPPINIITWSKVTTNPTPSDLMTVTNTDTSINFDRVVAPSGYPYIYKIQGNLYTSIARRDTAVPTSLQYIVECSLPNATSIGAYAFYNCAKFASINIPSVTSIGNEAFCLCGLTTINMPSATSIGDSAFESCFSLTTIDIPSATSIGTKAFHAAGLTTIDMPNVTSIGDQALANCSSLTTINMPSATSIGNYPFSWDNSLTTVTVGINTNQVATVGVLFGLSSNLQSIYVPDALVNDYKSATNWSSFASKIKGISEKPTT